MRLHTRAERKNYLPGLLVALGITVAFALTTSTVVAITAPLAAKRCGESITGIDVQHNVGFAKASCIYASFEDGSVAQICDRNPNGPPSYDPRIHGAPVPGLKL